MFELIFVVSLVDISAVSKVSSLSGGAGDPKSDWVVVGVGLFRSVEVMALGSHECPSPGR
jgi:hypothetical protein